MNTQSDTFSCGPLAISVTSDRPDLVDLIAGYLQQYDVLWAETDLALDLTLQSSDSQAEMGPGSYLTASRMHVDADETGLTVTCRSGASGMYVQQEQVWMLNIPDQELDIWLRTDIEHMLSLVLTTGWRQLGWVPLHSGAVVRGNICALLCAVSGGGKSTLTAALLRRSWRTLGDDKLLLYQIEGGPAELCALSHSMNLYPHTRDWFPEVGDISGYPLSSLWANKRRIPIADIWPDSTTYACTPTHLIEVNLLDHAGNGSITPLTPDSVLSILLHQTVIPADPATARTILNIVVPTAQSLSGIRLDIGQGAYETMDWLDMLEAALT